MERLSFTVLHIRAVSSSNTIISGRRQSSELKEGIDIETLLDAAAVPFG